MQQQLNTVGCVAELEASIGRKVTDAESAELASCRGKAHTVMHFVSHRANMNDEKSHQCKSGECNLDR